MSRCSFPIAGLRPAPHLPVQIGNWVVTYACGVTLTLLTRLLCIVLLGGVILCKPSFGRAKPAPDFAVPPSVGTTWTACRRKEHVPGEPPLDPNVPCSSYARFSSTLQSQESNADQQRQCRDKARLKGHRISPELEFADEAISGTKRHRAGLDAMLAAAEARRIKVLYFHSLSRLSRESVITLPLLKHLVYNCGVRIISVTEGIDSNDTAWELIAHIMSIVHEQYLKDLAANVLRGQEGALLAGFCLGDFCFGYSSVPLSATITLSLQRQLEFPVISQRRVAFFGAQRRKRPHASRRPTAPSLTPLPRAAWPA